jgi:hypothetical protein
LLKIDRRIEVPRSPGERIRARIVSVELSVDSEPSAHRFTGTLKEWASASANPVPRTHVALASCSPHVSSEDVCAAATDREPVRKKVLGHHADIR